MTALFQNGDGVGVFLRFLQEEGQRHIGVLSRRIQANRFPQMCDRLVTLSKAFVAQSLLEESPDFGLQYLTDCLPLVLKLLVALFC